MLQSPEVSFLRKAKRADCSLLRGALSLVANDEFVDDPTNEVAYLDMLAIKKFEFMITEPG